MSLSKEISEFTSGFASGWKLATPTAAEYAIRKDKEEKAGIEAEANAAESKVGAHSGRPYIPAPSSATGGSSGSGRRAGVLPASDEPIDKYAAAIKVNESSGNYQALGPVLKKKDGSSDQALGAYQVMASNLPSWSRKHLGREYTRDEFLKDQAAQDKVFRGEFGSYVTKYGNPQDAASVWFTGRPRSQGANARDVLGTSGSGYVKKFDTALASFAEGGRVPTDDEYARFMREAYAGSMDAEEAPTVESAGWTEPTVAAAPAGVLPVEVTGTLGPDQAVTAREPATPLPPRRPSAQALSTAPRERPQPQPKPRGVLPTEPDNGAPLPGEGMTAESDEPYDPRKVAHTGGIAEAIDAGLKGIGRMFGFSDDSAAIPAARPDRGDNIQRFHRNEGAASRQEIAQIDRTIDPENKLSADARAVARLYGGYQYFLKKGEPAKAEKYAQSILMYTRSHMQMSGALAAERLQAGDVGNAAKIIAEAHNEVPDGQTLQVGEAKGGKVPFKLIDEFGDLTEAGEANVNQLMHLATGMQNGSEWLSQIRGAQRSSLTAAQKARLRRQEADEGAANDFLGNSTEGTNEFLASMNDAQKDAYKRASPQLKAQLEREYNARRAQERQETSLADRQKKDAERADFYQRREQGQERDRQDQQEYAGHVANIKAAQADLDDQMATDPNDTAKVNELRRKVNEASSAAQQWTAGDAGRAKYVGMLRLETRPQRGAAGGGGGSRGGGTEAERKNARLDAAYTEAERAANREGAPPELKAQLPRLKADVEFRKRASDFDPEQLEEVDTRVAKQKGISDPAQLDPTERFAYHDAVSGLLRGDNGIGIDQAVALTQLAIKNGKVTILDDGRVKIGDARPVYISQEGLNALAILRQREKPAAGTGGATRANPFREGRPASPAERENAADAAQRVEGRRAASAARNLSRKSGEFARLKESLGADYEPDMTLADMRKALRDRTARNARIEMETGGFQVRPLE